MVTPAQAWHPLWFHCGIFYHGKQKTAISHLYTCKMSECMGSLWNFFILFELHFQHQMLGKNTPKCTGGLQGGHGCFFLNHESLLVWLLVGLSYGEGSRVFFFVLSGWQLIGPNFNFLVHWFGDGSLIFEKDVSILFLKINHSLMRHNKLFH